VDRFYSLAKCGYYSNDTLPGEAAGFFRVVPGFVTQWGIGGIPRVSQAWESANIDDEPRVLSNVRGTVAYAASMNASNLAVNRTTQVYVNLVDNCKLVRGVASDLADNLSACSSLLQLRA
jgi:homoserine O-acetyltransferase